MRYAAALLAFSISCAHPYHVSWDPSPDPVDHYVLCVNAECKNIGRPAKLSVEIPHGKPGDKVAVQACNASGVCVPSTTIEIPKTK